MVDWKEAKMGESQLKELSPLEELRINSRNLKRRMAVGLVRVIELKRERVGRVSKEVST